MGTSQPRDPQWYSPFRVPQWVFIGNPVPGLFLGLRFRVTEDPDPVRRPRMYSGSRPPTHYFDSLHIPVCSSVGSPLTDEQVRPQTCGPPWKTQTKSPRSHPRYNHRVRGHSLWKPWGFVSDINRGSWKFGKSLGKSHFLSGGGDPRCRRCRPLRSLLLYYWYRGKYFRDDTQSVTRPREILFP